VIVLLFLLDVLSLTPGSVPTKKPERAVVRTNEPALPAIFERQTTTLRHDAVGKLQTVSVQFDPPAGSRGEDVLRVWRDIRGQLLKKLGPPEWERSEGSSQGGQLLERLSTGEIVRMMEWRRPHTLRAGIPRKVDGRVVVEIYITGERLPPSELFWGEE
jgi:hypothetical protein